MDGRFVLDQHAELDIDGRFVLDQHAVLDIDGRFVLDQHAELDIDGRFVLDQHAELDIYNSSSLKQQSADRHVAQLDHINLILGGSTSLCSYSLMPSAYRRGRDGLTNQVSEPTIYHTRGKYGHNYTIDTI
jgi:hypothetical protein